MTEQERRTFLAEALAHVGYKDNPLVRHLLIRGEIHIWRRDCACDHDCNCWEFDSKRPATPEEIEIHRQAARPYGRTDPP